MVAGAEALVTLKDHAKSGADFFSAVRTPATLLAAGALKEAWVMHGGGSTLKHLKEEKLKWTLVRNCYLLLMVLAFGMNLMVVFDSTDTGMRLGAGGFDPMATSVVALLVREFEKEYVSVRAQYLMGIIAFMAAQALRVCSAFREFKDLAAAACMFLVFASCEIIQSCNSNLVHFGNVGNLLKRWWELQWPSSLQGWLGAMSGRPMLVIGNGALTLAVVFTLRMVYKLVDEDGDGSITLDEVRSMLKRLGVPFRKEVPQANVRVA